MKIGYARVSTLEQNLDLQITALQGAGCDKIITDKISGTKLDRPGLNAALAELKEGDTLVIWKLDRLGRSVRNSINITEKIKNAGAQFISLTENIDTSTCIGMFFFHLMSAFAEMERGQMRDRTIAGLAAARAQGRIGGRRMVMNEEQIARGREMLAAGATLKATAEALGVGVMTISRHCGPST